MTPKPTHWFIALGAYVCLLAMAVMARLVS